MKLIKKLMTNYLEPPQHTHPASGRFGLDHPAAYNPLHPKMTVCTDPDCRTYARLRRTAITKLCVTLAIWAVMVVVFVAWVKFVIYLKSPNW